MMLREEKSQQEGWELRHLRARNNKSPILKTQVKDWVIYIVTIIDTQEDIVAAAAESNLRC